MTATSNTHMVSLQSGTEIQDITMNMDTSGFDGIGILYGTGAAQSCRVINTVVNINSTGSTNYV